MWTHARDMTAARVNETVTLRGRVHNVRGKGKSAFLILRQQTATVQARSRLIRRFPPYDRVGVVNFIP